MILGNNFRGLWVRGKSFMVLINWQNFQLTKTFITTHLPNEVTVQMTKSIECRHWKHTLIVLHSMCLKISETDSRKLTVIGKTKSGRYITSKMEPRRVMPSLETKKPV
ncbi:hypothetical protein CEXT_388141 [Caerostris extrusa]|uniref:Uncharacterized protein n=1 Tax=Caerostris extrusa TaxID=172846 RepID=A0AAV4VL49_CAEEX|nr:hypothetical protein CEXT_388141 [Caerostris extrusa]